MVKDFLYGALLPLRSLLLAVRHPRLWPWMALPLCVTIAAYFWLWQGYIEPWRSAVTLDAANWVAGVLGADSYTLLQSSAQFFVSLLITAVLFIIAVISFGWMNNIVSLPVNDFLAQRVELLSTPPLSRAPYQGVWHEIVLILIDFKKSIFCGALVLLAISFAWVPIMNVVALMLTAYMLTFQYVSYAGTRRGWSVRTTILRSGPALASWLGFGLVLSVLLSIPIVGFLVHPIGIIGGTLLFARMTSSRA